MYKKGFTLIELLAVIVILAIIALIAVPILLKVISSAKIGALKDSTYGIIDAANLYYAQNMQEGVASNVIIDVKDGTLSYKGSVDSGKLVFSDEGTVSILIVKDEMCSYKDYESNEILVGIYENGYCHINNINYNVETLEKIDSSILIVTPIVSEEFDINNKGVKNQLVVLTENYNGVFMISDEEPVEKENGTVWITLGSDYNISVSNDNLKIPLGTAYIRENDNWSTVEAYVYNDVEWKKLESSFNNYKTWLILAGLNSAGHDNGLIDIINDQEIMNTLMSNEIALNYMISSTDVIMPVVSTSQKAMNALKESELALRKIAVNDNWRISYKNTAIFYNAILEANVLTNTQKYDLGLPCYLIKAGTITDILGNYVSTTQASGQPYGGMTSTSSQGLTASSKYYIRIYCSLNTGNANTTYANATLIFGGKNLTKYDYTKTSGSNFTATFESINSSNNLVSISSIANKNSVVLKLSSSSSGFSTNSWYNLGYIDYITII